MSSGIQCPKCGKELVESPESVTKQWVYPSYQCPNYSLGSCSDMHDLRLNERRDGKPGTLHMQNTPTKRLTGPAEGGKTKP